MTEHPERLTGEEEFGSWTVYGTEERSEDTDVLAIP